MDGHLRLSPQQARMNFETFLGRLNVTENVASEHLGWLKEAPTTHTLAGARNWRNGNASISGPDSVFFEHGCLLSEQARNSLNTSPSDALERRMTKARAAGLDRYVFAYLGVHEPYYSTLSHEGL